MTNSLIPTLGVSHTVVATTGFTIAVGPCNLDTDLSVRDFVVLNTSDSDANLTSLFTKTSTTVLTYTGPALTVDDVLIVTRATELARVQETLQLGSGVSSSILDAEVQRIYKLIAEKTSTAFFATQNNTVIRSEDPPLSSDDAPSALGDEWHVYSDGQSGEETTNFYVATDTDGTNDTYGWFEVTGNDGADGADGAAASITVGTTTTLAAGASATVTNAGSSSAAVFNFGIPKGADGDEAPTVRIIAANYTLTLSDLNTTIISSAAGAVTVLLPLNATTAIPIGTRIRIIRNTAQIIRVKGVPGVVLNGGDGDAGEQAVDNVYGAINVTKLGNNAWVADGDLA
jgi:hypothetical protein